MNDVLFSFVFVILLLFVLKLKGFFSSVFSQLNQFCLKGFLFDKLIFCELLKVLFLELDEKLFVVKGLLIFNLKIKNIPKYFR